MRRYLSHPPTPEDWKALQDAARNGHVAVTRVLLCPQCKEAELEAFIVSRVGSDVTVRCECPNCGAFDTPDVPELKFAWDAPEPPPGIRG